MNKPLIICVIGESGSGKTCMAQHIERQYGIQMINSHTDRPKRTPNELGHTFHTKAEYDKLSVDDQIASTVFGNHRYCCLKSDVQTLNTYVISEDGYDYLVTNFSDLYTIKSIRIVCSEQERIRRVGKERVSRDSGMFSDNYGKFDLIYNSELHQSILDVPAQRYQIESWVNDQIGIDVDMDNLIFMQ